MSRRLRSLAPTTGAVSWTIFEADDFNCPRIDIVFDAAPTSAGLLTVTKDSALGATYDSIIRSVDPRGSTTVSFENLHGFANGDALVVGYANPDGVGVTASATMEIPLPLEDLSVGGLTASAGTVRSSTSEYRRYYHIPMTAASPGATGATWIPANANQVSGYRLDAATEDVEMSSDIHQDWDGSSDIDFEATFTVNVDNSGGNPADVVDFKLDVTYAAAGDATVRSQSITQSETIGACAQYSVFKFEIEIDRNAAGNVIRIGDVMSLVLSVPATGDVTNVVINDAAVYYKTTHVGIESGDV